MPLLNEAERIKEDTHLSYLDKCIALQNLLKAEWNKKVPAGDDPKLAEEINHERQYLPLRQIGRLIKTIDDMIDDVIHALPPENAESLRQLAGELKIPMNNAHLIQEPNITITIEADKLPGLMKKIHAEILDLASRAPEEQRSQIQQLAYRVASLTSNVYSPETVKKELIRAISDFDIKAKGGVFQFFKMNNGVSQEQLIGIINNSAGKEDKPEPASRV